MWNLAVHADDSDEDDNDSDASTAGERQRKVRLGVGRGRGLPYIALTRRAQPHRRGLTADLGEG